MRAWSGAKTKEGRCGMTSEKPAARCQLRVKERMLLTPPRSVRAVRRLVMEERLRRSWCVHSASSWRESALRPSGDSFSNWTLRLPNDETLPVREPPPRSYWSQLVGFRGIDEAGYKMVVFGGLQLRKGNKSNKSG
jgi:hypothetical protein